MKKKTCTCSSSTCCTRWLTIIIFLFTLPLFSFWAGYEVAKVAGVASQVTLIDDATVRCSP